MLKSKAGWGQNAKAFVIHLAHQHIVHSYEVNSQWLANNQIDWVSQMLENMTQWHILKCYTVTEDKSCTIACGWTGFVFLSPFRSAGHFMHVAVSLADVVGPLFLNWSLPALYTLMMDTSTSALPWGPGVIDVTLPFNTVGDIKEDNQMIASFWCAICNCIQIPIKSNNNNKTTY